MAAIDKTYIKTAAQYKEVYDWVMSLPEQTDDLGLKFKLSDWLPREYDEHLNDIGPASPEYMEKQITEHKKTISEKFKNEKYWNENKQWYPDCETYQDWLDYVDKFFGEICLWNTPTWLDIFLIRNCPVGFIQDRLRDQYKDSYDDILNKTGEFAERKAKVGHLFKIPRVAVNRVSYVDVFVYDKNGNDLYYNKKARRWIDPFTTMACYDEYCVTLFSTKRRTLKRWISKWNLESGSVVELRIVGDTENKIRIIIK